MRFGEYLAAAIKRAGLSQREFASQVDLPQQNVNEVALGKRPPPLKRLPAWIKILEPHIDPECFMVLAWLECSPAEFRDLVLAMPGEVERLVEVRKGRKEGPDESMPAGRQ